MGKQGFFDAYSMLDPRLTFLSENSVPSQNSIFVSFVDIPQLITCDMRTIKWNYFFINHKTLSVFASKLNMAYNNLAKLLNSSLIHDPASVLSF